MDYYIVREDELEEGQKAKLLPIPGRELVQMNAAARLEMASGRVYLNCFFIEATDYHVSEMLDIQTTGYRAKQK